MMFQLSRTRGLGSLELTECCSCGAWNCHPCKIPFLLISWIGNGSPAHRKLSGETVEIPRRLALGHAVVRILDSCDTVWNRTEAPPPVRSTLLFAELPPCCFHHW